MRFTNRYSNGKAFIMNCALQSTNGIKDVIEKLAYYEDLEEQGRLIVLASNEDQLRMFEDKCKICPYWNGTSCNKTQCFVYIKIKELSK